jgi:hypothetical protein
MQNESRILADAYSEYIPNWLGKPKHETGLSRIRKILAEMQDITDGNSYSKQTTLKWRKVLSLLGKEIILSKLETEKITPVRDKYANRVMDQIEYLYTQYRLTISKSSKKAS